MSDKPKFHRSIALDAARDVLAVLTPACERIIVAGSLRRRKEHVGDVEIVYVPKFGMAAMPGMLLPESCNLADVAIAQLEADGTLARRLSKVGNESFGKKNKLMLHQGTEVPVDLFSTTEAAWSNYLVCRTGPAESNTLIATLAQAQGYKWPPYDSGFERLSDGRMIRMDSEEAVFAHLGIAFKQPWER